MTVFNTGLPSIRLIQSLIKNQTPVEIVLLNNKTFEGVIRWQDDNCLAIFTVNQEKVLVWTHAIAYMRHR